MPDALLVIDIETVPDEALIPDGWPDDRFPKAAWHRIVAIGMVEAEILRGGERGTEDYRLVACRSGGAEDWTEERLLRGFWRHFATRAFRCVTWNGRSFDLPTLLLRSMMYGIAAPEIFTRGTRWSTYTSRYSHEWHADLMEMMCVYGAAARLTLDEAGAIIGLPGKLGEHGSNVSEMVGNGEIARVRNYCETDVLNTYMIYLRYQHLNGQIDAERHDHAVEDVVAYLERERIVRPHLNRFLEAWRSPTQARPAFVGSGTTVSRDGRRTGDIAGQGSEGPGEGDEI